MSTSPEAKQAAEKLEKQVEARVSMRWEPQHGDMHEAVRQLLAVGLQEFADAATAKLREELEIWEKSSLKAAELPERFTARKVIFERQRCDYELYYGSQFICAGLYAGAAEKLAFELNKLLVHQQPSAADPDMKAIRKVVEELDSAPTPDVEEIAREAADKLDKYHVDFRPNRLVILEQALAQARAPLVAALGTIADYCEVEGSPLALSIAKTARAALMGEK